MENALIYLLLSAAIFIAYNVVIVMRYGILESISASYYALPERYRYIFTLTLWSFSGLIAITATTPYLFLACGGIMFVGAAAEFREDLTDMVHYFGAVTGIVMGLVHLVVVGMYHLTVAYILIFLSFLIFGKRSKVFWIEVFAFYTIVIGLILQNI